MARLHLMEIEDQGWCPAPVRDGGTDFLRFMLERTRPYAAIAPRLRAALDRTGDGRIVDLCSGAGGPWASLLPLLEGGARAPEVVLTDRYPNLEAFRRMEAGSGGRIRHADEPVDATAVPAELEGFRTLFTGFHHFAPDLARGILADAVRARRGIGIFEVTERSVPAVLATLPAPLFALLATPAIRPFRWSRLLLTYVLPAIPLMVGWDGVVSCLRSYTPAEMLEMAAAAGGDYDWQAGRERVPRAPAHVTYLIGTPRQGTTHATRGGRPADAGRPPILLPGARRPYGLSAGRVR